MGMCPERSQCLVPPSASQPEVACTYTCCFDGLSIDRVILLAISIGSNNIWTSDIVLGHHEELGHVTRK
jgi:hypothetical protein